MKFCKTEYMYLHSYKLRTNQIQLHKRLGFVVVVVLGLFVFLFGGGLFVLFLFWGVFLLFFLV